MSDSKHNYPFEDIVEDLLNAVVYCIADISLHCNSIVDINRYDDEKINKKFQFLRLRYRSGIYKNLDPHLTSIVGGGKRSAFHKRNLEEHYKGKTRISALIKQNMVELYQKDNARKSNVIVRFPSPFKVVYELLTVPDEVASKSYAFHTIRQFLLTKSNIQLENTNFGYSGGQRSVLKYENVSDSIETINSHRSRDDAFDYTQDNLKQFVYLILSVKGLLVPRVNFRQSEKEKKLESLNDYKNKFAKLLSDGVRIFGLGLDSKSQSRIYRRGSSSKLEMQFSPLYKSLPSLAEITNEIWGVPVPIRGADTILSGALKLSADNSLVVGVAGTPGAGKTSFGLALATSWAPLGTKSIYLTFEENVHDLRIRQRTIRPSNLSRTSYFEDLKERPWFHPEKMKLPEPTDGQEYGDQPLSRSMALRQIMYEIKERRFSEEIRDRVDNDKSESGVEEYISQVPLLIVLDGIQNYHANEKFMGHSENINGEYDISSFVEDCRALKAVVLVLSTSKNLESDPMERVVDVSIHIEHRKTLEVFNKPFRAFTLKKTRHQISRPGTSICHLNSEKGFRISPQLSSQIDKKSNNKQRLAVEYAHGAEQLKFEFFRCSLKQGKAGEQPVFADTYPNSNILLHGRGSSGKASLGLKFLFSPLTRGVENETKSDAKKREVVASFVPHVLVISFLYSEDYYDQLQNQIRRTLLSEFTNSGYSIQKEVYKPNLNVIHCHPGYLQPEDLYSKINNELDRAELSGHPYTGVLLDGLHNVFLQFPLLEQHGTIWPMLYASMRTRDKIQVVTTHTTISVGGGIDVESLYQIREDKPFLIALLQSTDFYFEVNRDEKAEVREERNEYRLKCISAIAQKVPEHELIWDKRNCTFKMINADQVKNGLTKNDRQYKLI